mgnify:CR=1 FL=1
MSSRTEVSWDIYFNSNQLKITLRWNICPTTNTNLIKSYLPLLSHSINEWQLFFISVFPSQRDLVFYKYTMNGHQHYCCYLDRVIQTEIDTNLSSNQSSAELVISWESVIILFMIDLTSPMHAWWCDEVPEHNYVSLLLVAVFCLKPVSFPTYASYLSGFRQPQALWPQRLQ